MKLPRINQVIIAGRLTRDGECKYLPNGTAVYHCNIAFDDGYWDKQTNKWVEQPVFIDAVIWGVNAEKVKDKLHKGSPVIIEGGLKQRSYTTKDGQNKRIIEINCSKIQLLEVENNQQSNKPKPDFNSDTPF